jgi:hypothetical protein
MCLLVPPQQTLGARSFGRRTTLISVGSVYMRIIAQRMNLQHDAPESLSGNELALSAGLLAKSLSRQP